MNSNASAVSTAIRNPWLDFYRFAFALVIALYHETDHCNAIFPRGGMAVYFFFLLSGYLAPISIERQKADARTNGGMGQFIARKLLVVQPALLITSILYVCVFIWHNNFSCIAFPHLAAQSILADVFMLRMTGVENSFGNEVTWYISAMILGIVILYPFIRKYGSSMYLLAAGILIIGLLKITTGTLIPYYATPMLGSYAGNYWGLGALAIGSVLPLFSNKFGGIFRSKAKHMACALLLAFELYCIHQSEAGGESTHIVHDTLGIISMGLMIAIAAVPSSGPFRPTLISKICTSLGKASLPFYLVHRSCM